MEEYGFLNRCIWKIGLIYRKKRSNFDFILEIGIKLKCMKSIIVIFGIIKKNLRLKKENFVSYWFGVIVWILC